MPCHLWCENNANLCVQKNYYNSLGQKNKHKATAATKPTHSRKYIPKIKTQGKESNRKLKILANRNRRQSEWLLFCLHWAMTTTTQQVVCLSFTIGGVGELFRWKRNYQNEKLTIEPNSAQKAFLLSYKTMCFSRVLFSLAVSVVWKYLLFRYSEINVLGITKILRKFGCHLSDQKIGHWHVYATDILKCL